LKEEWGLEKFPDVVHTKIASSYQRNRDLPLRGGNGYRYSFVLGIAFDIYKSVIMNFVGGFSEGFVEIA
jgi:hypothetical protein